MKSNLAEAERRIEEAREKKTEVLDLRDLELSELPASLGDLPDLKALYLGRRGLDPNGESYWQSQRKMSTFSDLSPAARLEQLQTLDLSFCTGVTDLAPIAAIQGLQNLLLSDCTGVTDLAPLAGIQGLQRLDLSFCTGVTDLAPLAGIRELQILMLIACAGVTDFASLADIQGLRILYLSCSRVTDLAALAGIQSLQTLDLGYCTEVTDLAPLAGIQSLQNLYLRHCIGVTDLAGIQSLQNLNLSHCAGLTDLASLAGIQGLQNLNLSYCAGLTDLTPLAGIQGLQNLNLSYCAGFTDLAPLAGIQGLQRLDLRSCNGFTDLAPLAGIQGLQSLVLRSCKGVKDLAPLAGIQGLQRLDLNACIGVTDLAPLAGIQGLQRLDLRYCDEVTDLAPLAGIQGLQSLDLSYCIGVTDLAPLAGIQGLQSLYLSYCTGVTDLAPLAAIQGFKKLTLWQVRIPSAILRDLANGALLTMLVADEAVGVPREVLSHEWDDNCLPRLRAYFAELEKGAESENEVKVILLGNGRVGKTQLCRRLRGDDFDESIESTHGVKIWRKPLRIRVQGRDEIFQINWWDFGGQDIYHGTHALFLRSRAVFLILWTPTLENRDEYTENGIPLRNQPLTYWLDYVRTLAGVESPVIVVQSQCDRLKDRRSPGQRPDGFKFFETCSYSAIGEELGRGTLEAHLRDAIRYLLDRDGRLEIGQGRAEVRRQLYQWRTQDQKRKPQKRRHRTLAVEEFRSLCGEVGNVSWEHALDYFHQTGVVIYQPDLFANIIVLDQDWALDAIYAVFHRGRSAPWIIEAGGRFTREDLALMVWQEHSIEEQRLFLGLMESCGVCFRCGESSRGEPRYIAPDLLPRFEVVANRLYAWKEDPGMPTLRLDYRFFHPAVIRGLMSEVGSRAGNFAEYWKYGLWLKDGHRDAQIIVDFKDTSTNEAPGAGALVLKAHGRDPMGPLRKIREMIFRQRIGERPEEFLTLEGTTVARSALASAIGGQVLDIQGQAVSAAPFVAFFENHNKPAEPEAKEKIMEPTLTPVPLNPDEKPREVYISYAWGDDTPAGQIRGKVVDNLYSALEKDGFRPIRDRDQIRTGDLISQFIERLTRGDWVVTIISDKYLRSPFCMYEIYRLWQKYQEDPQSMSRHVVPIVLPEVKIGRIRERAVYVEHWTDEAEDANEVLGNKKLMPHFSDKSVREARLTQRFADHVDDILHFLKDVLMERKLDVHFEGDFQAVREALRQRMEAEEPGPTGRQSPAQG